MTLIKLFCSEIVLIAYNKFFEGLGLILDVGGLGLDLVSG